MFNITQSQLQERAKMILKVIEIHLPSAVRNDSDHQMNKHFKTLAVESKFSRIRVWALYGHKDISQAFRIDAAQFSELFCLGKLECEIILSRKKLQIKINNRILLLQQRKFIKEV